MKYPRALRTMVTLTDRLDKAFHAITFREFAALLAHTIGAEVDYARGCWPSFRQNPLGYCAGRSPAKQGEALYQLALLKLRIAEETGRPIGCPGPGRCHGDRPGPLHCDHCGNVARVCDAPETCDLHRPWTAEKVRAQVIDILTMSPYDTYRRRATPDDLRASVEQAAVCAATPIDPVMVTDTLRAMVDEKVLRKRLRWEPDPIRDGRDARRPGARVTQRGRWVWDGALQLPLPTLPEGEHSPQCPINREHWNPDARHYADVCGWRDPDAPPSTEDHETCDAEG